MAKLRDGLYAAEDKSVKCKVKRLGTNNTRIVLDDGSEKLVPSECVTLVRQHREGNPRSRVVPSVPLEACEFKSETQRHGSSVRSFRTSRGVR
jgi:hypothetical protein